MEDQYWLECVGAGWRPLVEVLIRACERHGVEIQQVKEKFGGLRFYVGKAPEEIHQMIQNIEHVAERTCEMCGDSGILRTNRPWLKTLCDKHADIVQ